MSRLILFSLLLFVSAAMFSGCAKKEAAPASGGTSTTAPKEANK